MKYTQRQVDRATKKLVRAFDAWNTATNSTPADQATKHFQMLLAIIGLKNKVRGVK